MEITFLGTSAGTPTRDRNVSAVAVRHGGVWDLYDCGEATQHQIMSTSLSLSKLRRIFISHLHGDHCFGIFGLLGSRSMAGATAPLDVFGPAGLEEMVMAVLSASDTHLSYPITFHVATEPGGRVVDDDDGSVDAIALDHRVTSFAWCLRETERPGEFFPDRAVALGIEPGPAFARLRRGEAVEGSNGVVAPDQVIGPSRPGRSFIIAGDNRDPERLLAATGPVQLLVHEATFTEDVLAHLGNDRGHSTADRVGRAAEQFGVAHVLLTHFSPRYGPPGSGGQSVEELRVEAEAVYSGTVELAEDFATYTLDLDGELINVHDPSEL